MRRLLSDVSYVATVAIMADWFGSAVCFGTLLQADLRRARRERASTTTVATEWHCFARATYGPPLTTATLPLAAEHDAAVYIKREH